MLSKTLFHHYFFAPVFLTFGELLTILWFWSVFDNRIVCRTVYARFVAQ